MTSSADFSVQGLGQGAYYCLNLLVDLRYVSVERRS